MKKLKISLSLLLCFSLLTACQVSDQEVRHIDFTSEKYGKEGLKAAYQVLEDNMEEEGCAISQAKYMGDAPSSKAGEEYAEGEYALFMIDFSCKSIMRTLTGNNRKEEAFYYLMEKDEKDGWKNNPHGNGPSGAYVKIESEEEQSLYE